MTNAPTTNDAGTLQGEERMNVLKAIDTALAREGVWLRDLTNWADGVVAGIGPHLDDALLSASAQILMQAAGKLLEGDKGTQDRLAYVMYLDALIASPEAVQASLRTLRGRLCTEDTALALVK
jgi:hypothetical protein